MLEARTRTTLSLELGGGTNVRSPPSSPRPVRHGSLEAASMRRRRRTTPRGTPSTPSGSRPPARTPVRLFVAVFIQLCLTAGRTDGRTHTRTGRIVNAPNDDGRPLNHSGVASTRLNYSRRSAPLSTPVDCYKDIAIKDDTVAEN